MPKLLMMIKDRLSSIWMAASDYQQRAWWHWLTTPRDPITWKTIRKAAILHPLNTYASRIIAPIVIVVLLAIIIPPAWRWYSEERVIKDTVTYPRAALINPLIAGIGATLLIYAAIRQARTASDRHEAQTKADQQRRITESFSKATEQ